MSDDRTDQQRVVEAALGAVRWDVPKTDGFMRTMLQLVGVRCVGYTAQCQTFDTDDLVKLCRANGLPVAAVGDRHEHRKDDR